MFVRDLLQVVGRKEKVGGAWHALYAAGNENNGALWKARKTVTDVLKALHREPSPEWYDDKGNPVAEEVDGSADSDPPGDVPSQRASVPGQILRFDTELLTRKAEFAISPWTRLWIR